MRCRSDGHWMSFVRLPGFVLWSYRWCSHAAVLQPVGYRLWRLCYIWRKSGGVGFEEPILQEPHHTLIQFTCCQPWARVGAGVAKMNRSNKSTRTEKNRWGLFFINGVGVKLAGLVHVATHWIECLVYLGCVYRLRDDWVYSRGKTQWCSFNVTNQPHQQFIQFYTDLSEKMGSLFKTRVAGVSVTILQLLFLFYVIFCLYWIFRV